MPREAASLAMCWAAAAMASAVMAPRFISTSHAVRSRAPGARGSGEPALSKNHEQKRGGRESARLLTACDVEIKRGAHYRRRHGRSSPAHREARRLPRHLRGHRIRTRAFRARHPVRLLAKPRSARPSAFAADEIGAAGDEEVNLKDVTRKLVDCRKRKAASNAVDLLVSLGRAGIEPDLLASTTCLGACVAAGKMDLALKVFEEVFDKRVVEPDEVVFTELIRGYLASSPPSWTRAMNTLDRMEAFDVTPGALSYNILLAKCADDNELERAEDIVDRMADEGVEPDRFTMEAVKAEHPVLREEGAHDVSVGVDRGSEEGGCDVLLVLRPAAGLVNQYWKSLVGRLSLALRGSGRSFS